MSFLFGLVSVVFLLRESFMSDFNVEAHAVDDSKKKVKASGTINDLTSNNSNDKK